MRRLVISFLAIAIGFLSPLLVLEGVLRLLPVSDSADTQPVNHENPYIHFKPDRDVTLSKGWAFSIVVRKHVNNYGYMSDTDYVKGEPAPLLTIIGDSYVEADQVMNKESVHGLLAERLGNKGKVYGISYSGSPLSQYLAFSELARREFSPEGMAFVIIGNDFDESLMKYRWDPGLHYFFQNQADGLMVKRVDWLGPTCSGKLASASSLAAYLFGTVGLDRKSITSLWRGDQVITQKKFVGNVAADVGEERLKDSKEAIGAFFHYLPEKSGLSPEKILFVIDGMRPDLYTANDMALARGSYFDRMRTYFMEKARILGYEVIDMQPVFENHYARHSQRFEFPNDAHWNALGHQVVADEIEESRVYKQVFVH